MCHIKIERGKLLCDDFQTRPLIEESVLNATKSLLTDEIVPVQTEVAGLTGLVNEKSAKIDGFEQIIETMEKRMTKENEELKGLIGGLERSMALKDTEIAQLKQRLMVNYHLCTLQLLKNGNSLLHIFFSS